jgi:uncharacterized DUF497 family protein
MPPEFLRYTFASPPAGFEWDPAKSDWTLAERGFDFGFASAIFSGEILRRRDTRKKRETVFQAIGETSGVTLFVVYTMRGGRCRIISARRATPEETRIYHDR